MKVGVTSTGFRYQYEEANLDDMRFVDVLAVVVDEKSGVLDKLVGTSKLLTMMLGEEQKEALYKHIGEFLFFLFFIVFQYQRIYEGNV